MATVQSSLHGEARPSSLLLALTVAGLLVLQLWELPRLAAAHGGFAFVGAWLVCLCVFGLPLWLAALLMGRRSRRAPVQGMAFLTREADAPRAWRAVAWGLSLCSLPLLAALALLAGGHISFLARDLQLLDEAVVTASQQGLVLPLGTGVLLLLAALWAGLAPPWRARLQALALLLIVLLLAVAAWAGSAQAAHLYQPRALAQADWQQALRLALLDVGALAALVWMLGMQLPRTTTLARWALQALLAQAGLGFLLLLALAPFVAAAAANAGEALPIVPRGPAVWLLLSALLLALVAGLPLLASPLLYGLRERGLARLPALLAVFVPLALLAELLWWLGAATAVQYLLQFLQFALLLLVAGLALFAGLGLKTSHARKELLLPNERLYNLWRVLVRIALPLAVLGLFWVQLT